MEKLNCQNCGAQLGETDGKSIFLALASGGKLEVKPKKSGLSFECGECGAQTMFVASASSTAV